MTCVWRYGFLALVAVLLVSACGDGALDSSAAAPPPASPQAAFVTDAQGRALIRKHQGLHRLRIRPTDAVSLPGVAWFN